MYYYINNTQHFYIFILSLILIFPLYYIDEYIEFKKFAKKYFFKDIKFIPFTLNLIKHKIKR